MKAGRGMKSADVDEHSLEGETMWKAWVAGTALKFEEAEGQKRV